MNLSVEFEQNIRRQSPVKYADAATTVMLWRNSEVILRFQADGLLAGLLALASLHYAASDIQHVQPALYITRDERIIKMLLLRLLNVANEWRQTVSSNEAGESVCGPLPEEYRY